MEIDFSKCRVCKPDGNELLAVYHLLREMFPPDRPMYDELIRDQSRLCVFESYALYQDDELLGHVGLVPLKIYWKGRVAEILGVGAVATPPQHRRKGIINYLLQHCMQVIDQQRLPAFLFTELPLVYEKHGFKIMPQNYKAISDNPCQCDCKIEIKVVDELTAGHIDEIADLYEKRCPVYDGKIVKSKESWELYRMFFNYWQNSKAVLGFIDGKLAGYARLDLENDRLTIIEMCTAGDAVDVSKSLLNCILNYKKKLGIGSVSIALPTQHNLWKILQDMKAEVSPEPHGVPREFFMARNAAGETTGHWDSLEWPLSDKF